MSDEPSTVARYNPEYHKWEIKRPILKDGKPYKDQEGDWVREDWTAYTERECREFSMSNFINYWLEIVADSQKPDGEEATLSMLSKKFGKTIPTIKRKKSQIDKKYRKMKGIEEKKGEKYPSIFPPINKRLKDSEEQWIEDQKRKNQRETIQDALEGIDEDLLKLLNQH